MWAAEAVKLRNAILKVPYVPIRQPSLQRKRRLSGVTFCIRRCRELNPGLSTGKASALPLEL